MSRINTKSIFFNSEPSSSKPRAGCLINGRDFMSTSPIAQDDVERPFDLTKALQEFGMGLSDNESDSDSEPIEGESADWASIGLRPSWQQLQITLRDAQLNVMAGFKRQGAGTSCSTGREKNDVLSDNDEESPENKDAELDASVDEVTDESAIAEEDFDQQEDENGVEDESEDDEDDEDDLEEIGRLPTFHQLQFTLRNASEIIAHVGPFNYSEKSFSTDVKPADLLAKWTTPGRGIGWQSFMQNFALPTLPHLPTLPGLPTLPTLPNLPTLPSFLGDESDDEVEDCDAGELELLCRSDMLVPEDLEVEYNSEGLTGCDHYLRNCKVECSRCNKFYTCRLCHNENEQHEMDPKETRRMLCMNCLKPQPSRRKCRFCKEIMGDYYCSQCKLWNDDPDRSIYHCEKCGICRVGRGIGIDVFHCDTCGICMSLTVENNHKCIERAANSGCPICLDDLFSSTNTVVFMPCGHPIHKDCFTEYSKRYYRCPVCAKSILNTSALFRMIDEEVQTEVLPPELASKKVSIICQDCRLKSLTSFHLAGLKCETCGSYNTAQL